MLDPKLYTLLAVHECRSFVEASRRLSVTQPAVSHHIKLLEEELGVRIFERGGGRISLTAEGERVVQCARRMTALYEGLRQELREQGGRTHLSVGLTHTAESGLFARALARYCVQNGQMSVKVVSRAPERLYALLRSGEIDVAVAGGPVEPGFESFLLDTDRLIVAAPADHPLSRRESVTLEELKRERMLLRLPNSGTRNLFVAHLESCGMSIRDFNVVLELDNVTTLKDLIRGGFGVSVLPESVCQGELRRGELTALAVEHMSVTREVHLLCRRDFAHKELLPGLIAAYRDTVREEAPTR